MSYSRRSLRNKNILDLSKILFDQCLQKKHLQELLEVKYICKHKGSGVFARKKIEGGIFIGEYVGERISIEDGLDRLYVSPEKPSYLYFTSEICIDGDPTSIISFVNDSKSNYNAVMKRLDIKGEERIGLFSMKATCIEKGHEITYNYDISNKNKPWRKGEPCLHDYENKMAYPHVENPEDHCMYCRKALARDNNDISIEENPSLKKISTSSAMPLTLDEDSNGNTAGCFSMSSEACNLVEKPKDLPATSGVCDDIHDWATDNLNIKNAALIAPAVDPLEDVQDKPIDLSMPETLVSDIKKDLGCKASPSEACNLVEKIKDLPATSGVCDDIQDWATDNLNIKNAALIAQVVCPSEDVQDKPMDLSMPGTLVSDIEKDLECKASPSEACNLVEKTKDLLATSGVCDDIHDWATDNLNIKNAALITPPVGPSEDVQNQSPDLSMPGILVSDIEKDLGCKASPSEACNLVEKPKDLPATSGVCDDIHDWATDNLNIKNAALIAPAVDPSEDFQNQSTDHSMPGTLVSGIEKDLGCKVSPSEAHVDYGVIQLFTSNSDLDEVATFVPVFEEILSGIENCEPTLSWDQDPVPSTSFAGNEALFSDFDDDDNVDILVPGIENCKPTLIWDQDPVPSTSFAGNEALFSDFDDDDDNVDILVPESILEEITKSNSITSEEAPSPTKKFFKSKRKKDDTVQESESSQNKKRPKFLRQLRPCPFCSKSIKRFACHLLNCHREEKEMKEILATGNKRKRKFLFHRLRIRAIQAENEKRKGTQELMRLKQPHKSSVTKKRLQYQCSNCFMIYSEGGVSNHKKHCYFKAPARGQGVVKSLPFDGKMKESLGFLDDDNEFLKKVIEPMHEGFIKKEILNDLELLYIGNFLYLQHLSRKQMSGIEAARKKLRYLVKIKLKYNGSHSKRREEKMNLSNILHCYNWFKLRKLLKDLIYENKDGKKILKRGTSIQIKYAIEDSLKALIGLYGFTPGGDAATLVDSLTKFKESYSKVKDSVFGKVSIVDTERRAENRLVTRLPSENDMHVVIEECNKVLSIDPYELVTETSFVHIRRAAVTRLIFFNGRRPTEISMLTVNQWELAKKNCYLPSEQRKLLETRMDYNVLDHFRIIITVGKREDVPVIVPKLLFKVLDVLSDPEVRLRSGVFPDNPYLFPSTRRSQNHCSGTDCVEKFMSSIFHEKSKNFTSVQVRHLLATKFGMEDFPPDVRQCVFKFFGHSELINEINYQCPNVSNIFKNIAPTLTRIERGFSGTDSGLSDEAWRDEGNNEEEEEFIDEMDSGEVENIKVFRTPQKTINPLENFNEGSSPGMIVSDCMDEISSEEEVNSVTPKKKNKPSFRWSSKQNEVLEREFKDFLSGHANYPSKERIQEFLAVYREEFPSSEFSGANFKLRVKLNNMKGIRKKKKKIITNKLKEHQF